MGNCELRIVAAGLERPNSGRVHGCWFSGLSIVSTSSVQHLSLPFSLTCQPAECWRLNPKCPTPLCSWPQLPILPSTNPIQAGGRQARTGLAKFLTKTHNTSPLYFLLRQDHGDQSSNRTPCPSRPTIRHNGQGLYQSVPSSSITHQTMPILIIDCRRFILETQVSQGSLLRAFQRSSRHHERSPLQGAP